MTVSHTCKSCTNANCLIKRNSQDANMLDFLNQKGIVNCKKGQTFIMEGAPVHGLYFIKSGKVKVSKTGLNGKQQIVRIAGDGEIIGHRGFGAGQTYQISAIAIENAVLCSFSTDALEQMLHSVPSLTYDLMIFYAEELNRSETKVKKFAQMTVREKVIDAILYINRKFGQKNEFLSMQLSRREIADFAGTTEEQVIRVISALKKENLLSAKGKKIGITDVKLLSSEISNHNYFIDS
ncbi:MAG: Crp/Fnr family transcriptional regulator [Cyclobacteriaceae bacterium]